MSQAKKHYPNNFIEIKGVVFPLPTKAPQRRYGFSGSTAGAGSSSLIGMVVLGAGIFFAFPFLFAATFYQQVDPNKPLPGSALRRGAYMNWGSKDVGPDVDYFKRQKELRERDARGYGDEDEDED
eukprot:TRINITY_DN1137_c0_g1_i2.p3 TRINITY_DN1137_c0_g1~~TRINITY_DN1137_c0_g1_i2.p3  ORF type:complete len:125 (-),score=25.67 TRINITY_DN1137_c0_g1_i2:473-847(-)